MTAKNESSLTMSATELSALIAGAVAAALAEKKPSFDQVSDLVADRKRMMAEAARVWTAIYRDCRHTDSDTVFDALVQPCAAHPAGRIIRVENLRLDPARERAIYELAMGGESPAFRKLALYKKHGPTPDTTDAELARIEREAQTHGYRLAEVDRAMQHQIRSETLHNLIQPCRRLVGMTISEAKSASFGKLEILDEGLRSPFPMPSQEA